MTIKKLEVCLDEGSKGAKTMDLGIFSASSHFSDSWYSQFPTNKVAEKVHLGVLQHPTKS